MTLQGTLFVYLQSLLRFPFSHSLLTHSALFSTACVICDYLISWLPYFAYVLIHSSKYHQFCRLPASLGSYRMPLRADLVYDRFFIMCDISLISFMNPSCDKLFFIPFLVHLYYILRCFICKSFWQNRKLIGKISKKEKLFKQFLISFFFEFRKIRQFF